MRAFIAVCITVSLAGCDLRGRSDARASLLSESGGEVSLADGSSFGFRITSDKYKQWDAAQRGITKRIAARFGAILQPDAPTERSIGRAVAYLEGQPSARQAIETAGMSVRDFVVTTVALEQEMRLATGATREPEPAPTSEPYDFPPIDTTFIAPQPVPDSVPSAFPVDTANPIDTAFVQPRGRVDSLVISRPSPAPIPAPTIFRRDTTPSRTTVRRNTSAHRDSLAPRPVIRDTVRDTTPVPPPVPPDTLPVT